jgi:hypothetical protein
VVEIRETDEFSAWRSAPVPRFSFASNASQRAILATLHRWAMALGGDGHPQFETIALVLRALGLRLRAEPANERAA